MTSHPGKIHFATQSRKMSGILYGHMRLEMQRRVSGSCLQGAPRRRRRRRGLLLLCVCTWMLLWLLLGRKGGRCPRVCCELHETNLCTYVRPVVYYADQARWMDRVPIIKQRQTSATRHCALTRSANTQLLSMFSFPNIHRVENWQSEKEACI